MLIYLTIVYVGTVVIQVIFAIPGPRESIHGGVILLMWSVMCRYLYKKTPRCPSKQQRKRKELDNQFLP